MREAAGIFSVHIIPMESDEPQIGQMRLDKNYQGDLVASGKGLMLTGMGAVQGSAGYVAIEKVSGALGSATGSFLLQHAGTQQGDAKQLSVEIIPDSGAGELQGIRGTMKLESSEAGHRYRLVYALPSAEADD